MKEKILTSEEMLTAIHACTITEGMKFSLYKDYNRSTIFELKEKIIGTELVTYYRILEEEEEEDNPELTTSDILKKNLRKSIRIGESLKRHLNALEMSMLMTMLTKICLESTIDNCPFNRKNSNKACIIQDYCKGDCNNINRNIWKQALENEITLLDINGVLREYILLVKEKYDKDEYDLILQQPIEKL